MFINEELEIALEAARVGVWSWDIDTDDLRWSAQTSEMFGKEPRPFRGALQDFVQGMYEEDRDHLRKTIEEAISARSQNYAVEYRYYAAGGEVRWQLARGRVLTRDGRPVAMTGTTVDITEQKRKEEEYRLFTNLASDYVYVADTTAPTLAPRIVAGSFERTTSYSIDDVVARGGWTSIIHPDDRSSIAELLAALEMGKPFVNTYRILDRHGKVRWLRDRAYPSIEHGKLVRITGGVQDVTETKLLETQLVHARKMEALARLASGVAHDLNNLLTVMYTAGDLIRREDLSQRGRLALADMSAATRSAAELTRSLLIFGRRETGSRRPIKLRDLIGRAEPMIRRVTGEGVRLEMRDESEAVHVLVDASQIELALLNLAINARDAMPRGGTLSVVTRTTRSEQGPRAPGPGEQYGVIEVKDTGTGITPDDLTRIFEPFFTTKEAGKGTGLGLSTVHGVVSAHGGTIQVDSQVGSGTTFTLLLPTTADEPVPDPREATHAIGGNERILVIEDEETVRRLVVHVLRDLGYDVTEVGSVEEARRRGTEFDLIISDVRLPGTSGAHYARELAESGARCAVLLMSGFVRDDEQRAIVESGRFPLLPKPFTPDTLLRMVRTVLTS